MASMFIASSSSIADGAVSEEKLADQACSAAKMKKEGTSGHVLTSNGAGAIPSYQAATGGTGGLTLVSTQTASSNEITFSSLSGQKVYMLVMDLTVGTADRLVGLRVNADAADTNYYSQVNWINNSTASGAGYNGAAAAYAHGTSTIHATAFIWRDQANGYLAGNSNGSSQEGAAAPYLTQTTFNKQANITEITSIKLLQVNGATITGKATLYIVGNQV